MTTNKWRKYPKRITKWLPREDLRSVTKIFDRHKRKGKRDYMIKQNPKRTLYAIFVQKENKFRRKEDKKIVVCLFDRLISLLPICKKEGISILKTFEQYL